MNLRLYHGLPILDRIGYMPRVFWHGKESVMGRRLWYRDSYGRWHEDRHAGGRSGPPARWALMVLMMMAVLIVLASMIH